MAASPPRRRPRGDHSHQPDRLSNLPEALLLTILSLLPTVVAARTSVLSRRFRHLWKASPAIDLNVNTPTFEAAASSAILGRQPSNPLLSLRLDLDYAFELPHEFLCALLVKAHSLGLRHLDIDGDYDEVEPMIPTIFLMDSLHSLQLPTIDPETLPSVATFTRLTRLSLILHDADSDEFNGLLSQLPFLEDLCLSLRFTEMLTLSSQTIRKLDLTMFDSPSEVDFVALFVPSLEMLRLTSLGLENLPRIEGDMPSLRKAAIILYCIHKGDTGAVAELLNCVSHVEELSLDVEEDKVEKYPYLILLEPGKDVPNFRNLKRLDATMCFHEHSIQSIITLLRHTPVLESLKLVHRAPTSLLIAKRRKGKAWRSKLPRNAAGNRNYAYFTNLHLRQKSKEFMKLVSKKHSRK